MDLLRKLHVIARIILVTVLVIEHRTRPGLAILGDQHRRVACGAINLHLVS